MARPSKVTPDEIEQAALVLARTHGLDSLTARSVADSLGISTQPIYSGFGSMDALKVKVASAVQTQIEAFLAEPEPGVPPMLTVGVRAIRLAAEQPPLFALMDDWMRRELGHQPPPELLAAYRRDPRLASATDAQLTQLNAHLWIYTRGLSALVSMDADAPLTLKAARAKLAELAEALISTIARGVQ